MSKKIFVLFAVFATSAIPFFAGCESQRDYGWGEISVGDALYLSGRQDVQVANLLPVKNNNNEVFEPRGVCHTSLGATLTVVTKYQVGNIRNLLLRYLPPEDESCIICCPAGMLTSIRERDWLKLEEESEDMRERWILQKFEAEIEREVVKKVMEGQKK